MRLILVIVGVLSAVFQCSAALANDPRLDLARFHLPPMTVADFKDCAKLSDGEGFLSAFALANKTSVDHIKKHIHFVELTREVIKRAVDYSFEVEAGGDMLLRMGRFEEGVEGLRFIPAEADDAVKSFMCADAVGYAITQVGFYSLDEIMEVAALSNDDFDNTMGVESSLNKLNAFTHAVHLDLDRLSNELVSECVAASTKGKLLGDVDPGVMQLWVAHLKRRIDSNALRVDSRVFKMDEWVNVVSPKSIGGRSSIDLSLEASMYQCAQLPQSSILSHAEVLVE